MLKKNPIYPFLISAFSVLALGAHNIFQIKTEVILRPLAISLLLAGAFLGLSYLLMREKHRASVATTIFLLLFFSYGQIHAQFNSVTIAGLQPFRHQILIMVWVALLIAGLVWAGRWLKNPASWTPGLNMVSALLVLYPAYTIISTGVIQKIAPLRRETPALIAITGNAPNIYYIILDGYGRQDLLRDKLSYDNSDFINGLKKRGFYVAECSQSNYAHTQMSLTSSLNMAYLDTLPMDLESRFDRSSFLKHGAVRSILEKYGYETAAVPTGYPWSEWADANVYFIIGEDSISLTDFEVLLVQTTMLEPLWDRLAGSLRTTQNRAETRRLLTRNALEALQAIPQLEGQFFAFIHIVAPHQPYLFGPNGESVLFLPDETPDSLERKAYAEQAQFISSQILKVVDHILAKSEQPPIIIVQGDHGPDTRMVTPAERMQNLNALYLPGIDVEQVLYPSMTPVNTFRVVLNEFFGENLPLLEDRSYFSPKDDWGDVQTIPPSCPARP